MAARQDCQSFQLQSHHLCTSGPTGKRARDFYSQPQPQEVLDAGPLPFSNPHDSGIRYALDSKFPLQATCLNAWCSAGDTGLGGYGIFGMGGLAGRQVTSDRP